jgi:hypothetical protein
VKQISPPIFQWIAPIAINSFRAHGNRGAGRFQIVFILGLWMALIFWSSKSIYRRENKDLKFPMYTSRSRIGIRDKINSFNFSPPRLLGDDKLDNRFSWRKMKNKTVTNARVISSPLRVHDIWLKVMRIITRPTFCENGSIAITMSTQPIIRRKFVARQKAKFRRCTNPWQEYMRNNCIESSSAVR